MSMLDLRLVGVHADGDHLLFADENGERYRVPIDQSLREAIRRDRARALRDAGGDAADTTQLRPRDVQALLRAGVSLEEVSERSGWTVEKIQRYEPPVRAERDHVALLVQQLTVSHADADGPATFGQRVMSRLSQRGVDEGDITWDSWRTDTEWTVVAAYPAGGRIRQATWRFEPQSQTVRPSDDEARWLGEDDAPQVPARRDTTVFDLEANGGLEQRAERRSSRRVPGTSRPAEAPAEHSEEPAREDDVDVAEAPDEPATDQPVDLVSVMRERSKGRRRRSHRRSERQATTPQPADEQQHTPDPSAADIAPSDQAESTDEAASSSAEQLDHDPVTGTKDLFASLDDGGKSGDADSAGPGEARGQDDTSEISSAARVDHPRENPAAVDELADSDTEEIVVPSRPSKSRKGRPSVPSWDDIMFGANPRFED